MDVANRTRRRAYTTVMSLMNTMTDKGLLDRKSRGRAFVYATTATREKTLSSLVGDLLGRAFDGSASAMVAHLLKGTDPSQDELEEIHKTIATYRKRQGDR